jgi:hypothetical protein
VIAVASVDTPGRRPVGREAWGINPKANIFRLSTNQGDIEWALVAPDASAVAQTLASEGRQDLH